MSFKERINSLLQFNSDNHPVTSLYLKLGPEERNSFKYKTALKNLIKGRRDELAEKGYGRDAVKSVEADLEKIAGYVENPDSLTACRGIAVFSSDGEGVWEVFKLPFVYRERLVVDGSPLIRQLIRLENEFGDIAVVIIDREKARLFRINLDGEGEVLDFLNPVSTRSTKFKSQEGRFQQRVSPAVGGGNVPHGYGEHNFQRKIENEMQQHFKSVAEKLFEYHKDNKFDRLILGGSEPLLCDFSNHLHSYLKKKFSGVISADINTVKADELVGKALDFLGIRRREEEKDLLEEFEGKLQSGLAVNGLEDTLKSLTMGQVMVLLVSEGFSQAGYKCPESGVLAVEEREDVCPEGKKPVPVADVIDDAMEEALAQSAEVRIVYNEGSKKRVHGIGAILRFKI